MNPVLGEYMLLQFLKDGEYQDFACLTDCSIETTTEVRDVRTISDGVWKKKRGASLEYSVNCAGALLLDETKPTSFWLLENYQLAMLHVQWRILYEVPETDSLKIMTGDGLIESSVLAGAATGFATSDFRIVGSGPYTIETATSCQASIVTANVGDGDPDQPGTTRVTYELANTARLEYEVDGGGRETLFDPEDNGEFFIADLANGEHTLVLYVICESGAEGDTATINFTTEGGVPVDACAAPSNLTMLVVTGTSASCSWFALPAPADGYGYELENLNTGLIVQQGTQPGTTKVFSSLTPGTSYRVRIYSICELGVSVSAPTSKDFTTASATCNVPGAPVMSAVTSTTATATWTPASPAPADGYEWRVLNGVTMVNSGSVFSNTVDITALPEGASLTFQVRSACGGGQFSDWISTNFSTPGGAGTVVWSFTTIGSGFGPIEFTINKNSALEVQEFSSASGSFGFSGGDDIEVALTAIDGDATLYCKVHDDTDNVTIYENSDTSFFISPPLTLTSGHAYTINATMTKL